MAKIFINYRRDDSADYAGRLYDRLAGHFGHDHMFMDIDQIKPGEVFDQVIQDKLAAVQVAVVIIGKLWLDIADANGRRLDNPDDWVRLEIAALLERNIRVIPVLVGGATVPKSTQLPECLAPLTRCQASEITNHARFRLDTDKLIKVLEEIMGASAAPQSELPNVPEKQQGIEKPEKSEKTNFPRFVAIAGVAGIISAAGVYLGGVPSEPTPVRLEPTNPVAELNTAEAAQTHTNPIPIKKPIVEQPQPTIPVTIDQPVAEQPKVSVIEPEMIHIPPGKFMMGSHTELNGQPVHEVSISYAFEIGKYEVTFDEYDAFAKDTKRKSPGDRGWGRGKRPVVNVTFDDAKAYAQWLSKKTGKQYRLPTEVEWEYTARAGTRTLYWWGDDIGQNNAVCAGCGSQWDNKQTAPIGSFKANAFGLYDTAGNVWEWTQDCWHENYNNAPTDGFAWLKKDSGDCNRRVVRGGSWNFSPQSLRSAHRFRLLIDAADDGLGFRVARDF